MRVLLLFLATMAGLAGCAGVREKPVFVFDVDATQQQHLVFPPEKDGDVPRYVYMGHLYGDRNIPKPESLSDNLIDLVGRAFEFIKGRSAPRELSRPQSGMLDEAGRILVTDRGNSSVFVFDEKEASLEQWQDAEINKSFISPVGIALGPDGITYVADSELGFVARLDPKGNPLGGIGKGHLTRPTGIAYDAGKKRLFVVDTADHKIRVLDLEGSLLDEWGERGEGPGEFNYPTYVRIRDQQLFVVDTMNARVQILSTETGKHLATVGKMGMYIGELVRPKGVATDTEGNIYVIESYYDYMLIYNRKGEFLMSIGGNGVAPGKFHLPSDVWTDSRNRVFVADTLNSRVSVFQFLGGEAESE